MFFTNSPVVSHFKDVHDALRDPETFSSEIDLKLGNVRPMIPQQLDPPVQTRYRKLLDPLFSRKKMAELVPAIRSHAKALIDEFAEKGECEFDSAFAIPLPCTAFLSLFGLPLSDLPTFLEMKDGIIRPHKFLPPGSTDLAKAEEIRVTTSQRMYSYFEDEIARRRAHPKQDLLGDLLVAEIDGKKLEHNEILDICYLMLMAGLDTVTATLGCNIAYLAANPGPAPADRRESRADSGRGRGAAALGDARHRGAARREARRDDPGLRDQGGRDRHVPDRVRQHR